MSSGGCSFQLALLPSQAQPRKDLGRHFPLVCRRFNALSRRFHKDPQMFELFVILIDFHVGVPPSNIYATCERR